MYHHQSTMTPKLQTMDPQFAITTYTSARKRHMTRHTHSHSQEMKEYTRQRTLYPQQTDRQNDVAHLADAVQLARTRINNNRLNNVRDVSYLRWTSLKSHLLTPDFDWRDNEPATNVCVCVRERETSKHKQIIICRVGSVKQLMTLNKLWTLIDAVVNDK